MSTCDNTSSLDDFKKAEDYRKWKNSQFDVIVEENYASTLLKSHLVKLEEDYEEKLNELKPLKDKIEDIKNSLKVLNKQ